MTTPQPMTAAALAEVFFEVDAKLENAMLDDTGRYHAYAEAVLERVTTYAERVRGEAISFVLFAAENAHSGATVQDALSRLQHSYGKGWTNGYQQARNNILAAIRALSPTTEPTTAGADVTSSTG